MTIDEAIEKARAKLTEHLESVEARNIAAWRSRGHSEAEVRLFTEACREENELQIEAQLDELRAEMEHELRHGDDRVVH